MTLVVTINLDSCSVRCQAVPSSEKSSPTAESREESSLHLCHPVWTPRRSWGSENPGELKPTGRHLSRKETT